MVNKTQELRWIVLQGSAQFEDGLIRYKPTIMTDGPQSGQAVPCIIRSDKDFESGSVSFEVQPSGPDCRCQLILNHLLEREVFIGASFGPGAAYVATLYRAGQFEQLAGTGFGQSAKQGEWTKLTIVAHGSSLLLFVDGVQVLSVRTLIQKSQLALYIQGSSEVQIRAFEIKVQRPKAFVVMQFTEEFNSLYAEVIKPSCEKFKYEAIRADDIYNNGLIIDDITKGIEESAIVIADITPNNPNVYYEVGFAHGIRKPTILLRDKKAAEKQPFDLSGFRTLFYDNTIGGKSQVEAKLIMHLDNIKGPDALSYSLA